MRRSPELSPNHFASVRHLNAPNSSDMVLIWDGTPVTNRGIINEVNYLTKPSIGRRPKYSLTDLARGFPLSISAPTGTPRRRRLDYCLRIPACFPMSASIAPRS